MGSAVPFTLYYTWKRPEFMSASDEDGQNKEYIKALKWFGYGMLASYAPAVLMWPFTFLFNNWYQLAYLSAWGYPGWFGGIIVDIAMLVFFILAFTRHKD